MPASDPQLTVSLAGADPFGQTQWPVVMEAAQAAAALGMGEDACRKRVQRLRECYRTVLREEVARTVGSEGEIEDELRYLVQMAAALA